MLSILLLSFTHWEFFTSVLVDGFSLKFEWQQVSSSLQDSSRYLAILNNAVVWMVSTRPPTFKSSSPFNNPLVTVPKAPITIGCSIVFSIPKFEVLILLFTLFQFYSVVSRDSKVDNVANSLFFFFFFLVLDYYKVWFSGRDYVIRLYVKVP